MNQDYPQASLSLKKLGKLIALLKELFQLDQPDLDFGFYRIMHAKDKEVSEFLTQRLPWLVKEAFEAYRAEDQEALKRELKQAEDQARSLGLDPDASPKVQELRSRLEEGIASAETLEGEVYDHLYRFFRRYYSEGDFLSKRVYKEGVYVLPYEGEEVKLYWANSDQYYIKTTKYFREYAFCLNPGHETNAMRVRFQLVDAKEGEHGNMKEANRRVFLLADQDFEALENKELCLRFVYRPAELTDWPEDRREGQTKSPEQKDLIQMTEERIFALDNPELFGWIQALKAPHVRSNGEVAGYSRLQAHLDRYTKCNTFDYFIHKELGKFLGRELDFFIKNEVMRLDDIESATPYRFEHGLSKIKAIRKIASGIIAFLAQLEDFQKKLWLKKKFVTQTRWCVRMGLIPEVFLEEVCNNEAQRKEWVALLGIDALEGDMMTPGYSEPLTPEFLKAHPTLMLDTAHFDEGFTSRLLEAISDLDEKTDGILVHSENFQALNLMQARYKGQIKCVYIDPPYNTGNDEFLYKDSYQHSSWLAMMADRLGALKSLIAQDSLIFINVDDNEHARLKVLLDTVFLAEHFVASVAWQKRFTRSNNARTFASVKDFVLVYRASEAATFLREPRTGKSDSGYANPDNDARGPWTSASYVNPASKGQRPNLVYPIRNPFTGKKVEHPTNAWKYEPSEHQRHVEEKRLWWGPKGELTYPRLKVFLNEVQGLVPVDLWSYEETGTTDEASIELRHVFGVKVFNNPKPTRLVERCGSIQVNNAQPSMSVVLDYFAGSGTTGHAVINLNREDGGRRKFILVEMGDYFDTVLVPRLKKVAFSPEWKDGKPKRMATEEEAERCPRLLKILRMESYEDTLNNLEFQEKAKDLFEAAKNVGQGDFYDQYLMRYMLDVETKGSASLLNIRAFDNPLDYRLRIKPPGSEESREVFLDLIETFNWLIGLSVSHQSAKRCFDAQFKRDADPDLPLGSPSRLLLDGRLREVPEGNWWFLSVEGITPDGQKTLVIWRNRPGGEEPEGMEQDNLMLDAWFQRQGFSSKDREFDQIYVNGTNNLENIKALENAWKVKLIEETFHRLMFEAAGA